MISILFSIILAIALIIISLLLYLFIGCIIFEILDRHAWFDRLNIYDINKKMATAFVWPIIIMLVIIQLAVYIVLNTIPFIIHLFKETKEVFNEIKYGAWISGSLVCEICVKIFSRKK